MRGESGGGEECRPRNWTIFGCLTRERVSSCCCNICGSCSGCRVPSAVYLVPRQLRPWYRTSTLTERGVLLTTLSVSKTPASSKDLAIVLS